MIVQIVASTTGQHVVFVTKTGEYFVPQYMVGDPQKVIWVSVHDRCWGFLIGEQVSVIVVGAF
jgi:hypothetical protein